jgi:hypothetical protein
MQQHYLFWASTANVVFRHVLYEALNVFFQHHSDLCVEVCLTGPPLKRHA